MATLRLGTESILLTHRTVIGRAPDCTVRLQGPGVSGHHARVQWEPGGWSLRDLGSKNGTVVNRQPLQAGVSRALEVGDVIAVGRDVRLIVADLAPPCPSARAPDRVHTADDPDLMQLPGDPRFIRRVGEGWRHEPVHGEGEPVVDGDVVVIDGVAWTLFLPMVIASTALEPVVASGSELRFTVRADEEGARLELVHGARVTDLGERAHWYTLLTLARQRLADAQQGHSDEISGWIHHEALEAGLRVSPNTLYQHLHRCRRQLGDAGYPSPEGLIERRHAAGLLRLGTSAIVIQREQ